MHDVFIHQCTLHAMIMMIVSMVLLVETKWFDHTADALHPYWILYPHVKEAHFGFEKNHNCTVQTA